MPPLKPEELDDELSLDPLDDDESDDQSVSSGSLGVVWVEDRR